MATTLPLTGDFYMTPKRIHPLQFFQFLKWLDGSPLVIEHYRQRIFEKVLWTFDEEQIDQDLDLLKKLIACNPILASALNVRQKDIERKDANSICEIIPGRDVLGTHGGKFDLLAIAEVHTQKNGCCSRLCRATRRVTA